MANPSADLRIPHELQPTLADLVLGGVFERHARPRIVWVENDVSWGR